MRRRVVQTLADVIRAHNSGRLFHWRHNREVNDKRARLIADAYESAGFDAGPQPLVVGVLPTGVTFLLDGQHRLRAGEFLGADATRVEVEVVYESCADEAALRRLFRLINIGTPVPVRYYDEEVALFVQNTAPLIRGRWPGAYSAAPSCNRPRYTDNSLQHHLGGARCREAIMLGLMSPELFVEELAALCEQVEQDYKNDPHSAARRYATTRATTVFATACAKGFCAGVVHEWGDVAAGRVIDRHGGV